MSEACSPKVADDLATTDALSEASVVPSDCESIVPPTSFEASSDQTPVDGESNNVNNHQSTVIDPAPIKTPSLTLLQTKPLIGAAVKRPRHKPEERRELLQMAVREVQEKKISMRRAAQKYSLAKSSLCDYVRKNKIEVPNLRGKSTASQSSSLVAPFRPLLPGSMSSLLQPACDRGELGGHENSQALSSALNTQPNFDQFLFSPPSKPIPHLHWPLAAMDDDLRYRSGAVGGGGPPAKLSRLESPWNSAGLPTQVPMSTWSSNSLNQAIGQLSTTATTVGRVAESNLTPANSSECEREESVVDLVQNGNGLAVKRNDLIDSNLALNFQGQPASEANGNGTLLIKRMRLSDRLDINGSISTMHSNDVSEADLLQSNQATPSNIVPVAIESGSHANSINEDVSCGVDVSSTTPSTFNEQPSADDTQQGHETTTDSPIALTMTNDNITRPASNAVDNITSTPGPKRETNSDRMSCSASTVVNNGHQQTLSNNSSSLVLGSLLQCLQHQQLHGGQQATRHATVANNASPDAASFIQNKMWELTGGRGIDSNKVTDLDLLSTLLSSDSGALLSDHKSGSIASEGSEQSQAIHALQMTLLSQLRAQQASIGRSLGSSSSSRMPCGTSNGQTLNEQQSVGSPSFAGNGDRTIELDDELRFNHGRSLLEFANRSPSSYHVIQTLRSILLAKNFREIKHGEAWHLQPMSMVFLSPTSTSLTIAAVGGAYQHGSGAAMINVPVSSHSLRLVPGSERVLANGLICADAKVMSDTRSSVKAPAADVSWSNRELGLAGRVIVQNSVDGRLEERLVNVNQPVAYILGGQTDQSSSDLLTIVIGEKHKVSDKNEEHCTVQSKDSRTNASNSIHTSFSRINALVALALSINPSDILSLDVYFFDLNQGLLWGGLGNEFLSSRQLDCLFNVYTSLIGFIRSISSLSTDSGLRVVSYHVDSGMALGSPYSDIDLKYLLGSIKSAWTIDKTVSTSQPSDCLSRTLSKSLLLTLQQSPIDCKSSYPSYSTSDHVEIRHRTSQCSSGIAPALLRQVASNIEVPIKEVMDQATLVERATITDPRIPTAELTYTSLISSSSSCRQICSTRTIVQASNLFANFFNLFSKLAPKDC